MNITTGAMNITTGAMNITTVAMNFHNKYYSIIEGEIKVVIFI